MTHYEKLDAVLTVLLYGERNPRVKSLSIRKVIQTVAEEPEPWEIEHIYKRLLDDTLIERAPHTADGEPHAITSAGIAFIQDGGYVKEQQHSQLDHQIKIGTLRSFRYDKWALAIGLVSLILSLVALFK